MAKLSLLFYAKAAVASAAISAVLTYCIFHIEECLPLLLFIVQVLIDINC